MFGVAGLGLATRAGFRAPDGTPLVTDANYAALLLGGGIKYHVNDHWGLNVGAIYSPEKKSVAQPAISLVTAGISYKIGAVGEGRLGNTAATG